MLITVWAIFFWSNDKFFRIFLFISLAIHSVFLIQIGKEKLPFKKRDDLQILSYTFIQGALEEDSTASTIENRPHHSSVKEIAIEKNLSTTSVDESTIDSETEEETERPNIPVDAELPKIESKTWFDFNTHAEGESYRRELQKIINQNLLIPDEILKNGYEGKVKLWLNLTRDGKLSYFFLDAKYRSENDIVNKASIESVEKSSQYFPPLPEGVKDYDVLFYVILDFTNLKKR